MRNTLYFLLVAAIVFSIIWQSSVTSASNQLAGGQQQNDRVTPQVQLAPQTNYDIREEIRAASPRRVNQLGVAVGAVDSLARQKAMESFSAQLSSEARKDLQVVMDDTGLPKTVFNRKEPLSAPRSGESDSIARDFLSDHATMFGLNKSQIVEMKLENKDDDEGATFLNYEQTIDGIPVFQGQVQVAVNSEGQVMSVNEGLVIPNSSMNTTPRLSESEGLAQAFLSAGRLAPSSFEVMQNRQERGGRSVYQNPLGETRENILSGLT